MPDPQHHLQVLGHARPPVPPASSQIHWTLSTTCQLSDMPDLQHHLQVLGHTGPLAPPASSKKQNYPDGGRTETKQMCSLSSDELRRLGGHQSRPEGENSRGWGESVAGPRWLEAVISLPPRCPSCTAVPPHVCLPSAVRGQGKVWGPTSQPEDE